MVRQQQKTPAILRFRPGVLGAAMVFVPQQQGKRLVLTLTHIFATIEIMQSAPTVARFADMFSAMGTEPRLRIMQLLLKAHPAGLVVGELQSELGIPGSTLSHHLDKLRQEALVNVRRESTFLRYTANAEALQQLLQFLFAECCTRNRAVSPQEIVQIRI